MGIRLNLWFFSGEARAFPSCQGLIFFFAASCSTFPCAATLAQLVERLIRNEKVAGSSPAGGSSTGGRFSSAYLPLRAFLSPSSL